MSLKEKRHSKKGKRDANKKKNKNGNSSSESETDEHELFHYSNDRVQLMKEVLKILKSKKIKSLAPDTIKTLDMEEINTMLLEELLGISNKRLKKILEGQNADGESSSSSEDELGKPIDIISLDDISDDDLCLIEDGPSEKNKKDPKNDKTKNSKKHRIKKEPRDKRIKQESERKNKPPTSENEKLLSVLELLELQARARAIRSQIALEAENNINKATASTIINEKSDTDEDAVIVESPTLNEIIISSSESEPENNGKQNGVEKSEIIAGIIMESGSAKRKGQKVKIVRPRVEKVSDSPKVVETKSINDNLAPKKISVSHITTIVQNVASNGDNAEEAMPMASSDILTASGTDKKTVVKIPVADIPLPINQDEENQDGNKDTEEENGIDKSITKATITEIVNSSNDKSDSESEDVIRIDFVEIEGIDD